MEYAILAWSFIRNKQITFKFADRKKYSCCHHQFLTDLCPVLAISQNPFQLVDLETIHTAARRLSSSVYQSQCGAQYDAHLLLDAEVN